VEIQQIPAPTFSEKQRAAYIQKLFQDEGLQDVSIDSIGNVYGRLPGMGASPPIIVSAHSDTVFPEWIDLQVVRRRGKIYAPGVGDNATGLASLLGLLWILRKRGIQLPGDLWLVANVGEEGLGDLNGMRAVVDRFGGNVSAYLVLEGFSLGRVYHKGLGVQRYRVSIETCGGHSWVDYGQPSAIHELAQLITQLTSIPLPEQPRTTLNVGLISGGTSVNTIAAEAHLELDLRSEDTQVLKTLVEQVHVVMEAANRPGVQVSSEVIGQRPAGEIPADHSLVELAKRCLQTQGIQPTLSVGSTDANIPLSLGYPAICVGMTTGGGVHTINEYINTKPLALGLACLIDLVVSVFLENI